MNALPQDEVPQHQSLPYGRRSPGRPQQALGHVNREGTVVDYGRYVVLRHRPCAGLEGMHQTPKRTSPSKSKGPRAVPIRPTSSPPPIESGCPKFSVSAAKPIEEDRVLGHEVSSIKHEIAQLSHNFTGYKNEIAASISELKGLMTELKSRLEQVQVRPQVEEVPSGKAPDSVVNISPGQMNPVTESEHFVSPAIEVKESQGHRHEGSQGVVLPPEELPRYSQDGLRNDDVMQEPLHKEANEEPRLDNEAAGQEEYNEQFHDEPLAEVQTDNLVPEKEDSNRPSDEEPEKDTQAQVLAQPEREMPIDTIPAIEQQNAEPRQLLYHSENSGLAYPPEDNFATQPKPEQTQEQLTQPKVELDPEAEPKSKAEAEPEIEPEPKPDLEQEQEQEQKQEQEQEHRPEPKQKQKQKKQQEDPEPNPELKQREQEQERKQEEEQNVDAATREEGAGHSQDDEEVHESQGDKEIERNRQREFESEDEPQNDDNPMEEHKAASEAEVQETYQEEENVIHTEAQMEATFKVQREAAPQKAVVEREGPLDSQEIATEPKAEAAVNLHEGGTDPLLMQTDQFILEKLQKATAIRDFLKSFPA